jgi:ribosomal protein S18 acetylase RimI-like enzyme
MTTGRELRDSDEAMEVRRARAEDAARIAEIHVRSWQAAYRGLMPDALLDNLSIAGRQAFWEERIARDEATVLVAEADAVVYGWLVFGKSRDRDAHPAVVEVYGLYVDPEAWRRGVATTLWNDAKHRIGRTEATDITLWVIEGNERARRFYEAIGFEHEAGQVKPFERDGTVLTEVRYRMRMR